MSRGAAQGRHMRSVPDAPAPRRGGMWRRVIGVALFCLGAALFLVPPAVQLMDQRRADDAIEEALGEGSATGSSGAERTLRSKEGDQTYEYLRGYNERVRQGEGGPVNDPWGLGGNEDELQGIGLADGIIGAVSVPAMSLRAPLYIGASSEHLAHGLAVVSGTSMPLGEADSNVAIAGHRGAWDGIPMFRDIENVRIGDLMTIETPWDTLTYQAVDIRIVTPDETDAVAIQPGRDMVTLLSCHPYGHNYQRYLVYFERVAGDGKRDVAAVDTLGAVNPLTQALQPTDSMQLKVERWVRVAGTAVLLIVTATAVARGLMRLIHGRRAR